MAAVRPRPKPPWPNCGQIAALLQFALWANCGRSQIAAKLRPCGKLCHNHGQIVAKLRPCGQHQEGYTCVPRRMESLGALAVRHVSCGSYTAVALTTDGAAYTWGKGARGVLGHGHARDVAAPTRVSALSGTFVWQLVPSGSEP